MKHTKETEMLLNSIEKYLKNKFGCGELLPEWSTILNLLADNLDLYQECKKTLDEVGIYDKKTGRKNGLLSTIKDLQATILKQIQHLGLSPYALSKIKQTEEDNTEDFLDNLTK